MDHQPAPPHGYRRLRLGRFSEAGRSYLVTAVCRDRQARFADTDVALRAARTVHASATWPSAKVLAWVLMPDHLHLLLQLGDGADLSRVMGRGKALITRAAVEAGPAHRLFWQPGFHDRALRREEDQRGAARYLVANPLRAGLVESLSDYPYWNAVWLDGPDSVRD